jgi:hypothetical protein
MKMTEKAQFEDGILSVWEEGPEGSVHRSYTGTPSEALDAVHGRLRADLLSEIRDRARREAMSLVGETEREALEAKRRHEEARRALDHLVSGRSLETCPLPSSETLTKAARLTARLDAVLQAGAVLEAPRVYRLSAPA